MALSETLWDVSYDISGGRMAGRLLAVYAAVALAVAGWMAWRNTRFLLALRRGRVEALGGERLARYLELCKERGIRPVPVYWVDPLPGPCLVGVFRPYIALPLMLKEEDLLPVLTHELCHKKAGGSVVGTCTKRMLRDSLVQPAGMAGRAALPKRSGDGL